MWDTGHSLRGVTRPVAREEANQEKEKIDCPNRKLFQACPGSPPAPRFMSTQSFPSASPVCFLLTFVSPSSGHRFWPLASNKQQGKTKLEQWLLWLPLGLWLRIRFAACSESHRRELIMGVLNLAVHCLLQLCWLGGGPTGQLSMTLVIDSNGNLSSIPKILRVGVFTPSRALCSWGSLAAWEKSVISPSFLRCGLSI
jgi:hypothetical protein